MLFRNDTIENGSTPFAVATLSGSSAFSPGSSPPPPPPPLPPFAPGEEAGIGILLILIVFLSVAGNVLVCLAIARDRKLRKIGNLFLVSLAAADLIVSCLVMPFAVVNDLLGYWPFARWFCDTWVALDVLSATASILHLCAISLDRYLHMRVPFKYESWMSPAKCALLVAVTWLTALLISVVPVNLGWHFSDDYASGRNATSNRSAEWVNETDPVGAQPAFICSFDVNPTYAILSSAVSFYIPCVVMLGIYAKMYKLARRHLKKIQQTRKIELTQRGEGVRARAKKAGKLPENKALFTLGVILGAFLISWSPFFTVNVAHALCKCVPPEVFKAFTWLGYFNSAQNPIIYSIFNVDFRNSFARILGCRARVEDERLRRPPACASQETAARASDGALLPLLHGSKDAGHQVRGELEASFSASADPPPSAGS